MLKYIGILFLIISWEGFANIQGAVIDKEVTGVNRERIQERPRSRGIEIKGRIMEMPRASIPMDNYKLQREQLRLEKNKSEDLRYESITKVERKNPVWKYILGTLLIFTVGASVASS